MGQGGRERGEWEGPRLCFGGGGGVRQGGEGGKGEVVGVQGVEVVGHKPVPHGRSVGRHISLSHLMRSFIHRRFG